MYFVNIQPWGLIGESTQLGTAQPRLWQRDPLGEAVLSSVLNDDEAGLNCRLRFYLSDCDCQFGVPVLPWFPNFAIPVVSWFLNFGVPILPLFPRKSV